MSTFERCVRRCTLFVASAGALAAGCGLLGEQNPSIQILRDERMGFVEGPGIEVCFGGSRVVAPSRAQGGALSVCVSPGSVERTCSDTNGCQARERCVCGRCVTRPCRNATDCDSREVCQGGRCAPICNGDDECAPQETCMTGGCTRRCSSELDCGYGERCSALDGTCIVKLCGASVSCSGDDACVQQERVADLREPQVLPWAGEKIAFVELRQPEGATNGCAIYRARIREPRRWEIDPIEPVLSPVAEDGGCVGAPSAVASGSRMVLYAARGNGTGIVRATSADGVVFDRADGLVLAPTMGWEGGRIGSPGAVSFAGSTVLFYEADQGRALAHVRVDESTGIAGASAPTPWLTASDLEAPMFWRAVERISAPVAVELDGVLHVYFAGRGAEASDAEIASGGSYPADINDSIGLVTTSNLTDWERSPTGPIFARRTNLRAYLGELEPSVLVGGDGSWLVYVGADATGKATTGLGLATSDP